tara:strand:+ start:3335 stop:3895 length:561 start_codon:yes stop_codon:yes gene_type:complete
MNVLTIDVDYAFSPSISEYDDFVRGSAIELDLQLEQLEKLGLKPRLNEEKFSELVSVATKLDKNVQLRKITHHQEILNALPDCSVTIFNIDHHHDIFYPGWHDKEILDEGNWVYHLKSCDGYFWIRNKDSEEAPEHDLPFFIRELYMRDLLSSFPSFDLVVFCASPHWTNAKGEDIVEKLISYIEV